jgi:hypothetical protein
MGNSLQSRKRLNDEIILPFDIKSDEKLQANF